MVWGPHRYPSPNVISVAQSIVAAQLAAWLTVAVRFALGSLVSTLKWRTLLCPNSPPGSQRMALATHFRDTYVPLTNVFLKALVKGVSLGLSWGHSSGVG